ncbi:MULTISPECIES: FG-GAP-like repeat-containing protein [unclassified Flavobacterium]|uniref:FG-GAP-like repeat-containing protein n=1 Tax=unclassified Flavobacterium TaxID=196869 RepID=UPI001F140E19|nr:MULTISPECIES: FG-GAP-like repeat-containing protein [unclassified Flavobacterium]UMY67133.1 FG-GAP-like repeat-containing protein [Flavobacterium sp. HJ-32-4]
MKNITLILGSLLLGQLSFGQDTCQTALPVTGPGLYVVTAVNGAQVPSPICADNGGGATAGEWYAYTPAADHTVTITTDLAVNANKDTRVHIYTGTCAALNCLAGDDDSGNTYGTYLSTVSFNVTAGQTYIIAWDNRWNSTGFTWQLTEGDVVVPPPTPITYTTQGVATINSSYNICIADMNNDHLDDIVGISPNALKIHYQNADHTFTIGNFTISGAHKMPTWSMAAGDFNDDGYNDLVLGAGDGLSLWKSNSTGTAYTSVTPGQYIFCQRTNFADINNDGNLDIFSCHDVAPNVYYLNDGNGGMTYYQSGVTPGSYLLGNWATGGNYASLWSDLDNDGDLDMFISKCSGPPCEMHRNDGSGVFTNISALAGTNMQPIQSWSSCVADFDNDGDMDILIGSNGNVKSKLMKNNLDSTVIDEAFTDISAGSGWDTDNTTNRDYVAYDFDNDGYLDVLSATGRIMFNQGDMTFALVPYTGLQVGAVGDLNNDGFLDILNNSTIRYAVPNGNNWLKVALNGVSSNRNGIGARLIIEGPFGKKIRDVRSGEGFEFMGSMNVHFGIGTYDAIDKIVIIWPSGLVDLISNPSVNTMLTITEGETLSTQNPLVDGFSMYPNPVTDQLRFTTKSGATITSAQIVDMGGKTIAKHPVVTDNTIDVRQLATGAYIVTVEDGNGHSIARRFVKK